jgi:hypothetical protein
MKYIAPSRATVSTDLREYLLSDFVMSLLPQYMATILIHSVLRHWRKHCYDSEMFHPTVALSQSGLFVVC